LAEDFGADVELGHERSGGSCIKTILDAGLLFRQIPGDKSIDKYFQPDRKTAAWRRKAMTSNSKLCRAWPALVSISSTMQHAAFVHYHHHRQSDTPYMQEAIALHWDPG